MNLLFKFLIILSMFAPILGITSEKPSDLQCLTVNIYYEARGESLKGMRAIADTTLNRTKHPAFRGQDDVCKVVFARGQFSWTNQQPKKRIQKLLEGNLTGFKPEDKASYWESHLIAAEALSEGYKPLLPSHIVSFHNNTVTPNWSTTMKKYAKIGSHTFYSFKKRS